MQRIIQDLVNNTALNRSMLDPAYAAALSPIISAASSSATQRVVLHFTVLVVAITLNL
jgi:hypothetical protein